MAKWDNGATNQLQQLRQNVNATNQQIDDLRARINTWADKNPNADNELFEFTPLKMRNARVRVTQKSGWISSIAWGDNV
jgi:peptidoglycan hydrolase CwlO-like protein